GLELRRTAFILDSSSLIPFLAIGAPGHDAARVLVQLLGEVGALVLTTNSLAIEVRNHANWAKSFIGSAGSVQSTEVLEAATGRAGYRENLFLAGFIRELPGKGRRYDFSDYLSDICGERNARPHQLEAFTTAFERAGIAVRDMDAFRGFVPEDFAERDHIQAEVERLRRERDSFKSDLQTQVEAEARIIVEEIRSRRFSLPGRGELVQAFFVSNSRVVDYFDDSAERITMRPEAALQW